TGVQTCALPICHKGWFVNDDQIFIFVDDQTVKFRNLYRPLLLLNHRTKIRKTIGESYSKCTKIPSWSFPHVIYLKPDCESVVFRKRLINFEHESNRNNTCTLRIHTIPGQTSRRYRRTNNDTTGLPPSKTLC